MPPNHTHTIIVHSFAMYYQHLIVIHECSKKWLTIKSVFLYLLIPSTNWCLSPLENKFNYGQKWLPLIIMITVCQKAVEHTYSSSLFL